MRVPEFSFGKYRPEPHFRRPDGAPVATEKPPDPPRHVKRPALGAFDFVIVGILLRLYLRRERIEAHRRTFALHKQIFGERACEASVAVVERMESQEPEVRFVKEGNVDAVKLEGGVAVADKVEAIAKAGIVVFGHVGLTPQSSAAMGGFKVQGKNTATAKAVIDDAIAVYKAGARVVLLEGVPEETAAFIHKILPVPVYGIGAGADCDGQVLLAADALGVYKNFTPKFAKKYCNLGEIATQGMRDFIGEVKTGQFPAPEHKYKFTGDRDEFDAFLAEYEKNLEL